MIFLRAPLDQMLGKRSGMKCKRSAEQHQSQANAVQEDDGAVHWKALPRCWQAQRLRLVPDLHMMRQTVRVRPVMDWTSSRCVPSKYIAYMSVLAAHGERGRPDLEVKGRTSQDVAQELPWQRGMLLAALISVSCSLNRSWPQRMR